MRGEPALHQYKQTLMQGLHAAKATAIRGSRWGSVQLREWGDSVAARTPSWDDVRNIGNRGLACLRAIEWRAFAFRYKNLLLGLGVALFVLGLYLFFWEIPNRQVADAKPDLKPKEFYELKNSIRQTFAQAVGGAVLLIGLFFTWRNIRATERASRETLRISQEGQITDRFTKAINQLGETGPEKLAIRLGGIYALERIARDSEKDHWPVMEVLTAYVREHAPWKEEPPSQENPLADEQQPTKPPQQSLKPATDIQAILTVIGRRTWTYNNRKDQRLDLCGTDLRGARLVEARLQGAALERARLQGADFERAQLQGTDFERAQLQGANLWKAQLQGADFARAELQGARLVEAQLQGTDLGEAQLQGTNLVEAQLQGAFLVKAQLQRANLRGAQLQEALLMEAQLQGARLVEAQLEGANLWKAQLWGADFERARLHGAFLAEAQLQEAKLGEADFSGARLEGADLTNAIGLTWGQLKDAHLDGRTQLPAYLQPPKQAQPDSHEYKNV
jgi:uncharacterized protein YjbI with pentapeptide repeats